VSYLTQNEIANNRAMLDRVAQAAAQEDKASDPDRWTYENRRDWASAPGWDAAWESYRAAHPDEPDLDPGKDEGVITDGMILSQVQAMGTPPPGQH
jgi:hypothetical protein